MVFFEKAQIVTVCGIAMKKLKNAKAGKAKENLLAS